MVNEGQNIPPFTCWLMSSFLELAVLCLARTCMHLTFDMLGDKAGCQATPLLDTSSDRYCHQYRKRRNVRCQGGHQFVANWTDSILVFFCDLTCNLHRYVIGLWISGISYDRSDQNLASRRFKTDKGWANSAMQPHLASIGNFVRWLIKYLPRVLLCAIYRYLVKTLVFAIGILSIWSINN